MIDSHLPNYSFYLPKFVTDLIGLSNKLREMSGGADRGVGELPKQWRAAKSSSIGLRSFLSDTTHIGYTPL